MFCNIIITRPFDQYFTYKLKKGQIVKEGTIVRVPFGRTKNQLGMVIETMRTLPEKKEYKLKNVEYVFEEILLSKQIIRLINWISDYTLEPRGLVLKLFLINNKIIEDNKIENKENLYKPNFVKLNNDQEIASQKIKDLLFKFYSPIVLEGVTGSGKTEVYFEIVEEVYKKNKQILIMVPEISLTPQLEKRFLERFGFNPEVWHSKISEKKRKSIWLRSYLGEPIVVIGARSSLFLPFKKLGLIIVDEEHDISYKQEDNIRYHARDIATVRAKIEKCNIILSSATPSLETQNNINKKKYKHVFLKSQFSGIELPKIELINLNENLLKKDKWISQPIIDELTSCLNKKEQALLFLNRRGYSPLSLCFECGYRYQCNQCTSWLVMHRSKKRLLCHHCGVIYPIKSDCPKCESKESIKLIGPGIERIQEELGILFPQYRIGVMSSDVANTPNKIKNIVENFENNKIDILVATQIMAKGYHFPNLSFVGVLDADAGLTGGDMRAIERTYNLLQQVSGRAGRTNKRGKVLIQTYFPDQEVIQSLIKRDRNLFVQQALQDRKTFNIPPFTYMTSIIISGHAKSQAESYAQKLVQHNFSSKNINILGPVEAPIFLLRGQHRYRILIKGSSRKLLNEYTKFLLKKYPLPSPLRRIVDVDPYTFM